MPAGRPQVPLEQYKDEIAAWIADGHSHESIISRLQHNVTFTNATYYRGIKQWGIQKNVRIRGAGEGTDEEQEELKETIHLLFYRPGLPDDEILLILEKQGRYVPRRTLQRLRYDMRLKRRIMTPEERQRADEEVKIFLEQ